MFSKLIANAKEIVYYQCIDCGTKGTIENGEFDQDCGVECQKCYSAAVFQIKNSYDNPKRKSVRFNDKPQIRVFYRRPEERFLMFTNGPNNVIGGAVEEWYISRRNIAMKDVAETMYYIHQIIALENSINN